MPSNSDQSLSSSQKSKKITRLRAHPEWRRELDLLRRVIGRTRTVNNPKKELFSQRDHRYFPDLKIATVSTNLAVSDLSSRETQDYRIWLVKNSNARKRLRSEFLEHLEEAANSGAKFVCFNELAYPTPIDARGEERFRGHIKRLVKQHGLFLIGGGYHDVERCYNICPVFAPSGHRSQRPQVHSHAKMTSAVKAFELIRIPPNRNLRYYETRYGTFSVLICIDVYDPALVFRLMTKNHPFAQEQNIDIIFVPSFTTGSSPATAEACQDLSYGTASLVVYVNCAANEPRHSVFLAGNRISNGGKCRVTKVSQNVVLHEIPYDEYHRLRLKVSDKYSPVFEYLIGQKEGLRFDLKI